MTRPARPPAAPGPDEPSGPSVLTVVLRIVALNAALEAVVMFAILPSVPHLGELGEGLLDIALLSGIGGPLWWLLAIRPRHVAVVQARERLAVAHAAATRARALLEVSDRTAELLGTARDLDAVIAPFLQELASIVGGVAGALWVREGDWLRRGAWAREGTDAPAAASGAVADAHRTSAIAIAAVAGGGDRAAVAIPMRFPGDLPAALELHADHAPELRDDQRRVLAMLADRLFLFCNRKATEDELARAVRQATAAARAKSAFLANMSHELRTPMTAILGFADLLLEGDLPADERAAAIQAIRRNGRHLLGLVNDILDLSKIEADRLEIELVPCDLRALLAEVMSTMGVKAAEKQLAFDLVYATPLPAAITTDPMRVRQVLFNLAGNAIKFTAQGSVRLTVRWRQDAQKIDIEVSDTGPGIDAATLGRLFQPFAQADASTTRRYGGTGLGLAISRQLARLLGGALGVESAVGRGSTFTLAIATGEISSEVIVRGGSHITDAPRTRRTLSGRVLLAEDGPDNQRLVMTVLRRAGADIALAENGEQAVELALAAWGRGEPYDVILMDMQMPILDGYDATVRLRGKGYDRPIIAFTAHAMADDRWRCMASGCDDHVTKPIHVEQLLATIDQWIGRRSTWAQPGAALAAPGSAAPEPAAEPGTELDLEAMRTRELPTLAAPEDADEPPEAAPGPAAPSGREAPSPPEAEAPYEESELDDPSDPEMAALVGTFAAGLPAQLAELRALLDRGDLRGVDRLAHQLAGAAGSFGFPRITDAARALERAARAGAADLAPLLAELERLQRRIRLSSPAAAA